MNDQSLRFGPLCARWQHMMICSEDKTSVLSDEAAEAKRKLEKAMNLNVCKNVNIAASCISELNICCMGNMSSGSY